ncbi:MAG TPA: hypothetical protein VGB72_07060 [Acidobacteriota bacterium]
MGESKTIRVTPNMKKCLAVLTKAVAGLPPGRLRDQAQDALAYMSKTFQGRPQPLAGRGCPVDTSVIK